MKDDRVNCNLFPDENLYYVRMAKLVTKVVVNRFDLFDTHGSTVHRRKSFIRMVLIEGTPYIVCVGFPVVVLRSFS